MPGPDLGSKTRNFAGDIATRYLDIFGSIRNSPEMGVVSTDTVSIGSQNVPLNSEDRQTIQLALSSLAQRESLNGEWIKWLGKLSKQIDTEASSNRFFINNAAAVAITLGLHHIQAGIAIGEKATKIRSAIDKNGIINKESFLKDYLKLNDSPVFKSA